MSGTLYELTKHKPRYTKMKKQRPTVIYEDDDLIVVNKPANVLSIPDRYNPDLFNLKDYLKRGNGGRNILVVHRIDRETSGMIIFAKTKAAHKALSRQFSQKTIEKIYWAVVDGVPPHDTGDIDLPIIENPIARGTMKVDKQYGKRAFTSYKVIEKFQNFALLRVKIETGRMHQIRIHLKSIGYPLAVDSIYGRNKEFLLSSVKRHYNVKKYEVERPIISRITLHAYALSFQHPLTQEPLHFEAPPPKDLSVFLKQLRKYNERVAGF